MVSARKGSRRGFAPRGRGRTPRARRRRRRRRGRRFDETAGCFVGLLSEGGGVKGGARVRGGRGCARGEPGRGRGRIPGEPVAIGPAGEADAARGGSDGGDADAGDARRVLGDADTNGSGGGAPGRASPRRVASTRAGVRVRARARTCSPGRAASARASDLGGAAAMAPDADAPGPPRAGENAPARLARGLITDPPSVDASARGARAPGHDALRAGSHGRGAGDGGRASRAARGRERRLSVRFAGGDASVVARRAVCAATHHRPRERLVLACSRLRAVVGRTKTPACARAIRFSRRAVRRNQIRSSPVGTRANA